MLWFVVKAQRHGATPQVQDKASIIAGGNFLFRATHRA
jgi:hypothetical protein